MLAQEEARILRHNYVGTEHLLLGLLRLEEGMAAPVLDSVGLELDVVRTQVLRIVGANEEVSPGQIPFTPRAKKVLELSLREALSLGHDWIGPEHILLGLLREEDGVAARILFGGPRGGETESDAEQIRSEVIRRLPPAARREQQGRVRYGVRWPWLHGSNQEFLDRLAREIRQELHREPDVGDLLLLLACATDAVAGRALKDLRVDLDALWGAVERARREQAEAQLMVPAEVQAEIRRRLGLPGPPGGANEL